MSPACAGVRDAFVGLLWRTVDLLLPALSGRYVKHRTQFEQRHRRRRKQKPAPQTHSTTDARAAKCLLPSFPTTLDHQLGSGGAPQHAESLGCPPIREGARSAPTSPELTMGSNTFQAIHAGDAARPTSPNTKSLRTYVDSFGVHIAPALLELSHFCMCTWIWLTADIIAKGGVLFFCCNSSSLFPPRRATLCC